MWALKSEKPYRNNVPVLHLWRCSKTKADPTVDLDVATGQAPAAKIAFMDLSRGNSDSVGKGRGRSGRAVQPVKDKCYVRSCW